MASIVEECNVGTVQSREHAGYLLAEKLMACKNSQGIVVGIPKCGVPVAWSVAKRLKLPLTILTCVPIHHPGKSGYTIGSISMDEIVLHDCDDIPGDYLYHRARIAQSRLKADFMRYSAHGLPPDLENKLVIVVDDCVRTADAVLACIKTIQKQKPSRIIMAMVAASAQAVQQLSSEVDEQVCLFIQPSEKNVNRFRQQLPRVSSEEVMQLLAQTK
jgi:putative phosphoribosyl transferase